MWKALVTSTHVSPEAGEAIADREAKTRVLRCISGLAFEQQAIGRDALITEELARHVGL